MHYEMLLSNEANSGMSWIRRVVRQAHYDIHHDRNAIWLFWQYFRHASVQYKPFIHRCFIRFFALDEYFGAIDAAYV